MEQTNQLKLYSINAAAKELGLGKDSVYRLVEAGRIGYIEIGKRKKIPYQELIRFQKDSIKRKNIQNEIVESLKSKSAQNSISKKSIRVSERGHSILRKLLEN